MKPVLIMTVSTSLFVDVPAVPAEDDEDDDDELLALVGAVVPFDESEDAAPCPSHSSE